jgi:uncharacterized protein (TIGR03435 family)
VTTVALLVKGPSIFAALHKQLGLKLEPTHGPRGYLVIDAIERPTPDAPSPGPPAHAPPS